MANQVLELVGGMLQAHLNVEAVRHWANPTHWGDTLLFFLRRLLLEVGGEALWQTRLRSFGTHDGVLSFRHDVHGMRDYTFLDYQIENLIPATYDIEDPGFSTNITEDMAADWVARTSRHDFIEPALHNDSSIGDPPTAIHGRGPPRARAERHRKRSASRSTPAAATRAGTCTPRRSTRWTTSTPTTTASSARARSATTT